MPSEWEPQGSVLIAWPAPDGDFGPWLLEVEACYARIAAEISQRQRVLIACRDPEHRAGIEDRLHRFATDAVAERITFVEADYDDCWVRDTAPLTVEAERGLLLTQFRFNGWGGKHPHRRDAEFGVRIWEKKALGDAPLERVDFILEGGSIESDGRGTLLTTTRCLLNPNRNPHLSQMEIERALGERLGFDRVLWLTHGHAEGDDTDAHIDTLARFCTPDTIAYTACDDPSDSHYSELQAMAAELAAFRTREGAPYRLVPLPIPAAIRAEDGSRLPATYANFLIINDAVLLPVYGDPKDDLAADRLAECFPDRAIVRVDCQPLIRQYGSLHCMTMQFPAEIK